jgi:hypothetical protein
MEHFILSGVGGSTNWLPLIFPLAGIVVVWKLVEYLQQYIRRRRVLKEHGLADAIEPVDGEPNS